MQAVAAIAIPLCVATILLVPFLASQYTNTFIITPSTAPPAPDYLTPSVFLGVMIIGPIAGFAIAVGAFRGRWLMLTGLAALYFPFWWAFLLLYALSLSAKVAYYYCTDPSPASCWP